MQRVIILAFSDIKERKKYYCRDQQSRHGTWFDVSNHSKAKQRFA
jgi:hypothetical protein